MDKAWVPARGPGLPWAAGEYELLRDQVRRFVEEEIKPHADRWEEDGFIPRPILRRMGELGFFGIRYPAEYGGCRDGRGRIHDLRRGARALDLWRRRHRDAGPYRHGFRACLSRRDQSPAGPLDAGHYQRRGDHRGRHHGAGCRLGREGHPHRAPAERATLTSSTARSSTSRTASTRISTASPPRPIPRQEATGSRCSSSRRARQASASPAQLDKHGWRSSDTAELVFDGCRIPAENVLGAEGQGFYSIMRNFQNERLVLAAMAIGAAEAAIEMTLAWVKARRAFGGVLWDMQAIRERLAMLSAKVEAGRQFLYATAWRMAADEDCLREVSMVKAICGELVNEVMYTCVQFHGAMGFMRESPIERMARDARVLSIGGGATEVMLEVVASMS